MDKKIIDKIKKLFALGGSGNANEAAAAMSKARKLMDKYGIAGEDLASSDINEAQAKYNIKTESMPAYISHLVDTVNMMFQCDCYISGNYKYYSRSGRYRPIKNIVFFGYEPNLEICKYTFDNLARILAKARRDFEPYYWNRSELVKKKDAFCIGWVYSVRKQIAHLVPPRLTYEGPGLVPVDPLEVYLAKLNIEGSVKPGRSCADLCKESLVDGIKAGDQVQINKGMGKPVTYKALV